MKWRWVILISAIAFMSAGSFAVVLNEPWVDPSPNPFQCYALRTNVLGPQSWQVSCTDQHGDHLTLRFDDPLPPEAESDRIGATS